MIFSAHTKLNSVGEHDFVPLGGVDLIAVHVEKIL